MKSDMLVSYTLSEMTVVPVLLIERQHRARWFLSYPKYGSIPYAEAKEEKENIYV